MLPTRLHRGILPFRQVLGFAASQWARHPATLGAIIVCVLAWTLSDVLMPVFAGRLVDAVAATDRAARRWRRSAA